jgi:hypothetical protein
MWGLSSPWKALKDKDRSFVLEEDRTFIGAHNKKYSNTEFEIMTDVVPEPFIGNPLAPIWLLNLNPGFTPSDLDHTEKTIAMQKQSAALEANEFWYINPEYASAAGYGWWTKTLKEPIETYGATKVMKNFFCVELFPYHSRKFRWSGKPLPSQKFTLVVRRAAVKGKRFIIMRQRKNWLKLVPELRKARYTSLSSPRNVAISRKNLKKPNFLRDVF